MTIKERYYIEEIDKKIAQNMIIQNHYLHRKAPCSFAFGLFNTNNDIIGVIMYGTPVSSALRKGICGQEEKDNVIELTRLWITDKHNERNLESFLIGNTIKLIDKEIIVSFADPMANHVGYVYQATNWIYTGLSSKRKEYKIEGYEGHCHTLFDKYKTVENLKKVFGERNVNLVDMPRKYRYVYFNCNKRRKKELLTKLKYNIIAKYPKECKEIY